MAYYLYQIVEGIQAGRSRIAAASEVACVARYDLNRLERFEYLGPSFFVIFQKFLAKPDSF